MNEAKCSLIEHDLQALENRVETISKKIDELIKEMGERASKYMPAIALINQLKVEMVAMADLVRVMHLEITQDTVKLEASASSAHKRLDNANDDFNKLMNLPDKMRSDRMWMAGILITVMISFSAWTDNKFTKLVEAMNQMNVAIAINHIKDR